ncbi:hypothetical protein [Actinokineospora globicatena]|uniref:hypothetical protein n=1 Tax=Actinokineospora globicatena TaxID=103729 RepID=UPI0020A5A47F|nr:hypothetical protein [Actinokineospora globicatena]
MLTEPGWVPDTPIPLVDVSLTLETSPSHEQRVHRDALLNGLDLGGPMSYSDAVVRIAGMSHFTNDVVYRLVRVEATGRALALRFREARYFDYLDTGEVLAYKDLEAGGTSKYRGSLGNPFTLRNRVASLGVLTLTIVKAGSGPVFLMHKRSPKVVLASDFFHVVPAGEFSPSDVSVTAIRSDLDLWRNICREYAEELLGSEDAQGRGGRKLDYANVEPYKSLTTHRDQGRLSISVLGLGLDPLSLKPELLTVAVFDEEAFNAVFRDRITGNYEGVVVQDEPFDAPTVEAYRSRPDVRNGAKACLTQAWTHRQHLGVST